MNKNITINKNKIYLEKFIDNSSSAKYTFEISSLKDDWTKSYRVKLVHLEQKGGLLEDNLTDSDKDLVFNYARDYGYFNDPEFFEGLGKNQKTTLDYLNLQSLGLITYQKKLAEIYSATPLTIRDRIAYARRHNWIPKVGHGKRKVKVDG